jgi:hypothetical protein
LTAKKIRKNFVCAAETTLETSGWSTLGTALKTSGWSAVACGCPRLTLDRGTLVIINTSFDIITQDLIGFSNFLKHSLRLIFVARIFIGVPLNGKFSICLANVFF